MKNKIVINLQESSNAKEFDSGNLIHQTEYDRVIELINSRIDRASSKILIRTKIQSLDITTPYPF